MAALQESAWVVCEDAATHRTYYFNRWSGESSWTRPAEMQALMEVDEARARAVPAPWVEVRACRRHHRCVRCACVFVGSLRVFCVRACMCVYAARLFA